MRTEQDMRWILLVDYLLIIYHVVFLHTDRITGQNELFDQKRNVITIRPGQQNIEQAQKNLNVVKIIFGLADGTGIKKSV